MATPDMDVIKEIPGYKVILKAVLKAQIQQLIEQLAASTDEESVILTASVAEGTLSHLGSELGKGFLEDHEDVKSQFLGFCLKRQHQKQKEEEEKKRQQEMRNSMQQVTSPTYLGYGHGPMGNPGFLPRGPGTGFPVRRGMRTRGVRHEPYSQMPRQRAPSGSMPIPPVKPEPSEASNDSLNDSNNEYQSQSHSASSKDENQSNSVQSNESYTGGSGSDNEQSSECTRVKVESISESDLELEITGVEPGRPLLSPDWDPNVSMGMGSGEDSQGQSITKTGFPCEECGKILSSKGNRKLHMKIHSGDRPFKCLVCEKTFTHRGNLNSHMVTHLNLNV